MSETPKGRDQVMGHADENDGIEEYDNPLPDWWLGMFLFCIVWAIGYGVDYHFVSHRSEVGSYEQEIAEANARWPAPKVVEADLSPETIAAGEQIFQQNCTGCHGTDMKGKIGPNLIDDQWIHGGTLEEITHTVTNGVPDKGMLTWGPILGPEKVAKVAAFVYSKGPKLGLHPDPSKTPPAPAPAPGPAPAAADQQGSATPATTQQPG